MNIVGLYAAIGVCLGALALEAIALIIVSTPWWKAFAKKARREWRLLLWRYFNWRSDFEEE